MTSLFGIVLRFIGIVSNRGWGVKAICVGLWLSRAWTRCSILFGLIFGVLLNRLSRAKLV